MKNTLNSLSKNGMTTLLIKKSHNAIDISFTRTKMVIYFKDGRELSVPLEWIPSLRNATLRQLENRRLIGEGEGIHWEELDEDISIEQLLK